ncbi:sugar ABC transporter permease [Actinoallomurus purpureus]|jgi:xylobiose transport system permease protein|uniref:carbohydrate ABC transporter permease n=1 Tax=Actinoallomurus purpureus TaxID=478114 RepID=UPI0020924119|nr:sugar ABC transporter permease [Actinoallomurus purpureus]MCO6009006.1 sugar ABC transporter permease [Actinoallomurus purpureus]
MTAAGSADRAARPGALWIVPAALFFGVFAGVPLVLTAVLSFTSWNGLGTPAFNGLDNWSRVLSDDAVWESLRISLVFMVLCWLVQTPLALLLGVWAAGRELNRAVLSSIFFLPLLMSTAAIAISWRVLLDPNFGLAATIGPYIGFPDGNIVGSQHGAVAAVVIVIAWQFVPFHTLLYQGAARQIPQMLYDAALIDGASRVRQFWHITLPQLRHTIVTSSVLMLVGSLTYFETILIVTNGGPGSATMVLPQRMYLSAFQSFQMGYASVIALVLAALGTALSLLIVRFSGFAKMRSTLEGI